MRTSIAGAAILLAGAGAASLAAAVDTTGSNRLNGSDTLFDVTQSVIASCKTKFGDFAGQNITYLGGGSGVGAGAMGLNNQQVSPMSRALKNSEYCAIAAPASAGLSEGLLVGIDGVAISANQTNSCSSTVANGFGTTAPMEVLSGGNGADTGNRLHVRWRHALLGSAFVRRSGRPLLRSHERRQLQLRQRCAEDAHQELEEPLRQRLHGG